MIIQSHKRAQRVKTTGMYTLPCSFVLSYNVIRYLTAPNYQWMTSSIFPANVCSSSTSNAHVENSNLFASPITTMNNLSQGSPITPLSTITTSQFNGSGTFNPPNIGMYVCIYIKCNLRLSLKQVLTGCFVNMHFQWFSCDVVILFMNTYRYCRWLAHSSFFCITWRWTCQYSASWEWSVSCHR